MLEKFRRKYIGDRNFYGRYIALALPMIIQNAVTNLVSFLDNIMVGQLGTEQMSGVAIVNQLIFVYNLAVFGAVSAASIFGAQYFGKGNHKGHMYSFRFKLYAALAVTALTILLFVTNGESLISLYLTDTSGNGATGAALQYGLQYLIIMMAGLIPFAVNQSYATNIKETGQTLLPMIASFVAVGSNAILDYLLIFGIGPFPELGVQGAALATVIARYIEALMIIIWAHSHREKNRYLKGAYTGFGIPTDELKAIIIKGLPLMMNEVLWAAGMTAVIQCYSVRGLEVVAGLNIATTITNLFNIIYIQLGACISIVVGQYLGAGELEEAKDADNNPIAAVNFSGKTIKLTADIDLGNQVWTPIGNGDNSFAFSGTFDGDGYTISGLNVPDTNAPGLFGYIFGTVQNLIVKGSVTVGENADDGCGEGGGVVCDNNGTVQNCGFYGSVNDKTGYLAEDGAVGGVSSGSGKVLNCWYYKDAESSAEDVCGGTTPPTCVVLWCDDSSQAGNAANQRARNGKGVVVERGRGVPDAGEQCIPLDDAEALSE